MKRSELTEFSVEEEGFKLKIRRGYNGLPVVSSSHPAAYPQPPAVSEKGSAGASSVAGAPDSPAADEEADEPGVSFIKSPMVGTFYRSSSPESKPFVDLGSKVSETSVICIIEAMKIMNEIQAETKGSIVEILVENGQPVEYGQRLFKVKQG